ncbi:MAG: response regulator, partial [Acidobacteriota bacterium]
NPLDSTYPYANAILGIVNSVTLSLALTSLIGYSFGITYVLPFNLGSQMALHTSAAFLVYGIATLSYAWKYAERRPDGLPKWGAGIGVALLPVLLVCASAVFPRQSWRVVLFEALFSIIGVALISLAVLRLTTAKVAYKGLLLIATPLILLLLFVGLVVQVKHQSKSDEVLALHSQEVIGVSQLLLIHLSDTESAVRGYVITGDQRFVSSQTKSLESVAQMTLQLQNLVNDNPLQQASAGKIRQLTAQRMDHLSSLVRLVKSGNQKQAEEQVKVGTGADLMERVRAEMSAFSREEERLGAERRQILDTSWQRLSWLLVAGTAAAILLASILTLLFSGGISRRLQQLRDNALSLAEGKELAPPLTGQDEIAELDRVFHKMADLLDERTRREKAVIEGTSDAIFIKDLEHRYLMMNQAGADAIGTTIDKVIGASNDELIEADSARRIRERDNEVIASGQTITHEFVSSNKAGVERAYLSTRAPYRDRQGRIVGTFGISRDITEQKRAEAALIESDRRFRSLFYDAPVGYHEVDIEGRITCVNTTELLMLGYASDEMIGHHIWEFIEEAELVRTTIAEKIAGILPLGTVERSFRCKDGTFMAVQLDDQMLNDQNGRTIGIRATMQDIRERKLIEAKLKESELQLVEAQYITQLGSWTWDIPTNTTSWSKALYYIYGVGPEDLPATIEGYLSVVHPADREIVFGLIKEALRTFQGCSFEHRIIRPDKTVRVHHLTLKVTLDGNGRPVQMFGTAQDITERVQLEEALKDARDMALESVRLKSEFLANMSHEIRTPMNGVIGMSGLLLQTELTAPQQAYAETIESSAEALLTIIDDILDFSKIEAGLLRFEKIDFDLRSAVEATIELLAERAHAKGLELASLVYRDVPTALQGDPGRLRQVLTNLIGNAIKFTANGEVVVRVKKISETESRATLRFEIQDTGIGISTEEQSRLFRPFTQADGSTTRKYGGTGLGLVISKQLVELMGGQIGIESTPGVGSTFWFSAEFEIQHESTPTVLETTGSLAGVRVLIVDDNSTNRNILNHQTSSWGMIATEAESGTRALQMLRASVSQGQPFNIALLDLMMPAMDGFQLAGAIKADPEIAAVALVLLPSFGEAGHDEKARQLGIAAYLQKPVRQSKLYNCLMAVLAGCAGIKPLTPAQLAARHSLREAAVRQNPETLSTARIIIAEDNLVNQQVALGQLYNLGYRAEVVANGLELLAALEKAEFDLILMDCQMPEMDGFAATAEIRRREDAARHSIIIAITANALDGDAEKCLAAGMDDYLSKPVKVEILRQKLERWISPAKTSPSEPGLGGPGLPGLIEATVSAGNTRTNVIDQNQLASLRAIRQPGNGDFVTELIDMFVSDTVAQLKVLHEAVAGNDVIEIRRLAHFLKGSSANIGAMEMTALYEQLERVDSANGDAGALIKRLDQEFELAREALKAERQGMPD